MILNADLGCEIEQRVEARPKVRTAGNLAADIADHPAEPDAQELQLAPHALELMRMGVAPDHDCRALGDPDIALTKRNPSLPGEANQLLQGPMHEPGIGRMGDRLGLHRRVHDDPLQVPCLDRTRLVRHR